MSYPLNDKGIINHIVKHPDTLTPLITGVEPAKSDTFNTLITRCFTICSLCAYYKLSPRSCQVINNCGNQDICTILKPSLEELGCPTKLFITGGYHEIKNQSSTFRIKSQKC